MELMLGCVVDWHAGHSSQTQHKWKYPRTFVQAYLKEPRDRKQPSSEGTQGSPACYKTEMKPESWGIVNLLCFGIGQIQLSFETMKSYSVRLFGLLKLQVHLSSLKKNHGFQHAGMFQDEKVKGQLLWGGSHEPAKYQQSYIHSVFLKVWVGMLLFHLQAGFFLSPIHKWQYDCPLGGGLAFWFLCLGGSVSVPPLLLLPKTQAESGWFKLPRGRDDEVALDFLFSWLDLMKEIVVLAANACNLNYVCEERRGIFRTERAWKKQDMKFFLFFLRFFKFMFEW